MIKNINKSTHSEWVVRNSLYWMSVTTRWRLHEDDQQWIISFDSFSEENECEFERILNDYKLRENLQLHTGQIRLSIIDNVLKSIDSRLSQ